MSILESAQGRRRHLLDEKSYGDLDRMNSIIGGRPQQPESSAPTPRDHYQQKPPDGRPQHQAYVSDRHAPSLSKPHARYRSPERSFAGPRRGRGSQAMEQDFDVRPPDHYAPDRPSFSAAVFGRRQRVRSPQPERPSGRISPRGMREAGARPRHGFFLNDPSQEPQCISAMRFNDPPRAVNNRHNEGQVRETIEWDPRNVGDRGPLWEPPPGASCRLSPIGALVQCSVWPCALVCGPTAALLQPYLTLLLRRRADSRDASQAPTRDASPSWKIPPRAGRRYLPGPQQRPGPMQEPFGDNIGKRAFTPPPTYTNPSETNVPPEAPEGRRKLEGPAPVVTRGGLLSLQEDPISGKRAVEHRISCDEGDPHGLDGGARKVEGARAKGKPAVWDQGALLPAQP